MGLLGEGRRGDPLGGHMNNPPRFPGSLLMIRMPLFPTLFASRQEPPNKKKGPKGTTRRPSPTYQPLQSSKVCMVVASGPTALAPGCRKRLPRHHAVFLTEWESSPTKFFHPKPVSLNPGRSCGTQDNNISNPEQHREAYQPSFCSSWEPFPLTTLHPRP